MKNHHGSAILTLPSDREICITRQFNAPAALVFTAWTTPEIVRRWWGSADMPLTQCEIDLRIGGAWPYVMAGGAHGELGWHGTYRDITRGSNWCGPKCSRDFLTPRR